MFDLSGKVILVAGGAGYLGQPVCKAIHSHGGTVVVADANPKTLSETCALLGCEGTLFSAESEESIKEAVASCLSHHGRIDGLVSATAYGSGKTFDTLSLEDFDRANHINLTGTFALAREASHHMQEGGSIVLFASMYGLVSPDPAAYPPPMPPNPIDYGAGKAGVVQMTRYMAGHLGPRRIRVNAIAPGPFPHPPVQDQHPEFVDGLAQRTMLKRLGAQHECSGPVTFLLSNAASYVTGQCLAVDGGWTSW